VIRATDTVSSRLCGARSGTTCLVGGGRPAPVAATAMLCRLIILAIMPPLELAAAISTGLSSGVWPSPLRLPKRALAECWSRSRSRQASSTR